MAVEIYHPYVGDLVLRLVAPDGTIRSLRASSGGDGDQIIETYTVDASSELANGLWSLQADDTSGGDVGHIDRWTMTF